MFITFTCHEGPISISLTVTYIYSRSVFLNRWAAAWYWALASIKLGREKFSWS